METIYLQYNWNLTTVALPNLIAHDLVLVYPMSSFSGYVNYLEYTLGSNKGQSKQGDVINSPFALGTTRDGQAVPFDYKYTSSAIELTGTGSTKTTFKAEDGVTWTPIIAGTVRLTVGTDTYVDDGAGKIWKLAEGSTVARVTNPDGSVTVTLGGAAATDAGTVVYTGTDAGVTLRTGIEGAYTLNYNYNNVVVPQNDLPIINVEMKSMALIAKARRIAVYYSQIAAFQAKTDYGFDLGDQLAEKAVGELAYEIDTEIVNLLNENAGTAVADTSFNKALPVGVSKAEHYEGFKEAIEAAKRVIYDRTKRFAPNYMVVASDILQILSFLRGWSAASTSSINGPYFAGTLDGLKVFVSPSIPAGRWFVGVNGDDMMSSAAVYAPFRSCVKAA